MRRVWALLVAVGVVMSGVVAGEAARGSAPATGRGRAHASNRTRPKRTVQEASPKVFYVLNDNSRIMITLGGDGYSPTQDPRLWLAPQGQVSAPAVTRIAYVNGGKSVTYQIVPTSGQVVYALAQPPAPHVTRFRLAQYEYDSAAGVTRLISASDTVSSPLDQDGPAPGVTTVAIIRLQRDDDGARFRTAAERFFQDKGYRVVSQALVNEAVRQLRPDDPLQTDLTTKELIAIGEQVGAHYVVVGKASSWSAGWGDCRSQVRVAVYDSETRGTAGGPYQAEDGGGDRDRAVRHTVNKALENWGL